MQFFLERRDLVRFSHHYHRQLDIRLRIVLHCSSQIDDLLTTENSAKMSREVQRQRLLLPQCSQLNRLILRIQQRQLRCLIARFHGCSFNNF